jgi:mannosyltransferase
MLPWERVAGASEFAMRVPSVLAMALAATLVSAIAARLHSERVGLAAGLIFALLPVVSRYGQEARSYAFVVALAVLASYCLVRGFEDPENKRWRVVYSIALAVMGWANLMSLLIIPAHAVTLLRFGSDNSRTPDEESRLVVVRGLLFTWGKFVLAAVLAVCPLLILAWPQRDGTQRFLARISFNTVGDMPGRLTGSWLVLILLLPLIFVALRKECGEHPAAAMCLPWVCIPPLFLLGVGALIPVYDPRYILFCVPPVAILAAIGMDRLASSIFAREGRFDSDQVPGPWVLRGLLAGVVLIGVAGIPSQLSYRAADGHVDNIRLAARIVARHELPGDAVLYDPPWWRQVSAAYPYGFRRLRDASLRLTPAQAGNFTGVQYSPAQVRLRLAGTRRVWLVEFETFVLDPALGPSWRRVKAWHPGTLVLVLYQRQR